MRSLKILPGISGLILLIFLTHSCKKEEIPTNEVPSAYDLFPLKKGNKYHYSYDSFYQASPYEDNFNGKERWTVLSDSLKESKKEYLFETVFNGTEMKVIPYPYKRDTIIIKDKISYFKVIQDSSGLLVFGILSIDAFQRYQNVAEMKGQKTQYGIGNTAYTFYAGRGLIKYNFYYSTNQVHSSRSYTLDSAKIYN
jgi:hypothetical protein